FAADRDRHRAAQVVVVAELVAGALAVAVGQVGPDAAAPEARTDQRARRRRRGGLLLRQLAVLVDVEVVEHLVHALRPRLAVRLAVHANADADHHRGRVGEVDDRLAVVLFLVRLLRREGAHRQAGAGQRQGDRKQALHDSTSSKALASGWKRMGRPTFDWLLLVTSMPSALPSVARKSGVETASDVTRSRFRLFCLHGSQVTG